MRRNGTGDLKVAFSISTPPEVKEWLRTKAEKEDRPMSWIVMNILKKEIEKEKNEKQG